MPGLTREVTLEQFAAEMGRQAAEFPRASLRPPLKTIAVLAAADFKSNFEESHAPDGSTWAPLRYARVRGGSAPLRDRGLLMASVGGQGAGHVETITDDALSVGTNLAQAPLHQFGGTVTPKKGKFLAIPLTVPALHAGSPRNFAGLHPVVGKKGGVLADDKGTAHYALTKGVTVPARAFIGWSARLVEKANLVLAEFLERLAGGGGR